jgi:hypothetical protein
MPFDPQTAREAQEASVRARLRRRDLTEEERALDAIGAKLGALTKELLKAAMGEEDFEDLKPETRLTAILRAMEWKLGKAPTAKLAPPEPDNTEVPQTGEDLFT